MKLFAAVCALCVYGCATTKEASKEETKDNVGDVEVAGPQVAKDGKQPPAPEHKVSAKAKLLFEDAVKAYDAQKRANTFDWQNLEKRFKAVLDEDPNLAEASYNLGVIAERQNKKQ